MNKTQNSSLIISRRITRKNSFKSSLNKLLFDFDDNYAFGLLTYYEISHQEPYLSVRFKYNPGDSQRSFIVNISNNALIIINKLQFFKNNY